MTAIPRTPVAGPLEVQAPAWFISDLHLTPGMPRTQAAFERTLVDAGLEDVEIQETHAVHEFASSAIIRARKP